MRVAFDARLLAHPGVASGGIGRYTSCLLDALEAAHRDEVVVLRSLRRPPAPERLREGWEHLLMARDARRARATVIHSPAIDLVSLWPGAPLVVSLHDLVPLKQPERYLRTGLKHWLRYRAVERATRVIVPARVVAEDAERLLDLAPERIDVVADAAAPAFHPVPDPRSLLERLELPERFLVWVGGLDPPTPARASSGSPQPCASAAACRSSSPGAPGRARGRWPPTAASASPGGSPTASSRRS